MATTVIIPARNEEATIGNIVAVFNDHPETRQNVYVILDADTTDKTADRVWRNGGCAVHTDQRGKGQVVHAGLSIVAQHANISPRIILCDGDYTGLHGAHINHILSRDRGMTIGVPDWPEQRIPDHVINAWPRISGFRCLPWSLIPDDAHGYLLETQINLAAIQRRLPIHQEFMRGLKSPFQWPQSPQRAAERIRDREWGKEHGIL